MTMGDLFAGLGGFRIAFEEHGAECVWSCEMDKYAVETYNYNFGALRVPTDIKDVDVDTVPHFDLLTAGFPCPSFSLSGVSKRNSLGREHGFEGEEGDLFFDVLRFIDGIEPFSFLLENVKNLIHHDGGKTFDVVMNELTALGYTVDWAIFDAAKIVPQHRERVFIAGFRDDVGFSMGDVNVPDLNPKLKDILDDDVDDKYILGERTWECLQKHKKRHAEKGHGFGYSIADPDGVSRTMKERYHKDGSEILISRGEGEIPRRLTEREAARLFGYPEWYEFPVSRTQAYRQLGNTVVVPLVSRIAETMLDVM